MIDRTTLSSPAETRAAGSLTAIRTVRQLVIVITHVLTFSHPFIEVFAVYPVLPPQSICRQRILFRRNIPAHSLGGH